MTCLREGWELVRGRYWLFVGISLVGVIIGSLAPMYILWGPMVCGIQICLLHAMRGRTVKFESLFKGFDYFVPSLVATLIWAVPLYVIMLLAYLPVIVIMFSSLRAGAGGPPSSFPTAFLAAMAAYMTVIMVASFVVAVLTIFLYPLLVDRKLPGVAALKTSARAAMGNMGGVLGLVLLNYLFMFVGLLACYVGAIFVLPLHFASITIAYRQVFPDEYVERSKPTPEELDYDDQPDLEARPPEDL
jgi:uncharacterized membrane protein